jgi:hypothetical protein
MTESNKYQIYVSPNMLTLECVLLNSWRGEPRGFDRKLCRRVRRKVGTVHYTSATSFDLISVPFYVVVLYRILNGTPCMMNSRIVQYLVSPQNYWKFNKVIYNGTS